MLGEILLLFYLGAVLGVVLGAVFKNPEAVPHQHRSPLNIGFFFFGRFNAYNYLVYVAFPILRLCHRHYYFWTLLSTDTNTIIIKILART